MTTQINKVALKNSLEENIRLYPDSWKDADVLEDYVKTLWEAEDDRSNDLVEEFPTYTEYLRLHIEILWEIKENHGFYGPNDDFPEISPELSQVLHFYQAGYIEDAYGNTINFEYSDGSHHTLVYSENPNFKEDPENEIAMVWCVDGYDKDGNHYEGDDFEYLYEALEDLVMSIQV